MIRKTLWIITICVLFLLPLDVYSSSNKEDYELQERCGKRCEEYFKNKYGPGFIESELGNEFSYYENHYNKKLNKCFIYLVVVKIIVETKKIRTSKYLRDIHENKDYGSFIDVSDMIEKNVEPYIKCVLLDKTCNSEKEWNLLVKPYMEE
jgi:hypothetical protein